jgi:hypothetical protein
VVTALVTQLDPQTVLLNFADIVDATTGVFSTDIPQSALAELAQLGVRTKEQKITSVNFVPPLIEPWDYDPAFVRQTVSDALEASEAKASASPSASAPATPAAAAGDASSPEPSATASVPAVMENPGTDPDANTEDLADVCAAG